MDEVIDWLLQGDPSVRWQTERDLTGGPWETTRRDVPNGWAGAILAHRRSDGTWPTGWYSPKWTSTFYSTQVLAQLGVPVAESVNAMLNRGLSDGRFRLWQSRNDDVCVTAMMLTMARGEDVEMPGAVERLLEQQLPDGGWNCRRGATHASVHSTLSVLEALGAHPAAAAGREFLLRHRLFRSHRTGAVMRAEFTRFSFPTYWYYDVLRALDYWRGFSWDDRLEEAVEVVRSKAVAGRWRLQNPHRGETWVEMEKVGQPSRMVTLRALRVLQWADQPRNT